MRTALFGFDLLKRFFKMFERAETQSEKAETIQEIAVKLAQDQLRLLQVDNGPRERTVFMLGSKGVGKSTVINKFFDREESTRPTLALEYSYGRRTSSSPHVHKQVLNVWELGSLENAQQLIEVPLRTHGVQHFAAVIVVDLSQPQRIWLDLECAYRGLKDSSSSNSGSGSSRHLKAAGGRKEHVDIATLQLMPFPLVIVGGKYDIFMDFDPAVKKHICCCLRSLAHLVGASLLFYSARIPKLAKTLRDTISHLGFGSPTTPFRAHVTDYNEALSIWCGTDSWERIGAGIPPSVEHIGAQLALAVPQLQLSAAAAGSGGAVKEADREQPASLVGFGESIIDEMRAQKDEELQAIVREAQLRGQFESVAV